MTVHDKTVGGLGTAALRSTSTPRDPFGPMGELLKHDGIKFSHLERLMFDRDYLDKVAKVMLENKTGGPIPEEFARTAFNDNNFFGVSDWVSFFGLKLKRSNEHPIASEFPWGLDALEEPCPFNSNKTVQETHFAFLGVETINRRKALTPQMWKKVLSSNNPFEFNSEFSGNNWFKNESFLTEKVCLFRWYLMPTDTVLTGMTYEEQLNALPDDYEIAGVGEEITKHILYQTLNNEFIDSSHGRCREITQGFDQHHIAVSGSNRNGLCFDHEWDHFGIHQIGLAVSRKIPDC